MSHRQAFVKVMLAIIIDFSGMRMWKCVTGMLTG